MRTTARMRFENRRYLKNLLRRSLKAPCPTCKAKPNKPCIHLDGPHKGQPMAQRHGDRAREAARLGYIDRGR